jgi:hypothetical protein
MYEQTDIDYNIYNTICDDQNKSVISVWIFKNVLLIDVKITDNKKKLIAFY